MALIFGLLSSVPTSCTEPTPFAGLRLRPVAFRDLQAPILLRPLGVAIDDGDLLVVESGRLTLTTLGEPTEILDRRSILPTSLPPGVRPSPTYDIGSQLLVHEEGLFVLVDGLGPLFLPRDRLESAQLIGAGAAGVVPAAGGPIASADLSDTRGLALDADGHLIVATHQRIYRLLGDELELLAGSGISGLSLSGPAEQLNPTFGQQVGLALDPDQNLYFTDLGSGRIWRVTTDGQATPIAGGGDRYSAPLEPTPATDIALELSWAQMAWDPWRDELLLLSQSVLYRIAFEGDQATIRAVPSSVPMPRGLAVDHDGALVSSLWGLVDRADDDGGSLLWHGTDGTIDLGRAAAIAAIGTESLLIQDVAQRTLSISIPNLGIYPIHAEASPGFPPSAPVAADRRGFIYLLTPFGLRFIDVNGLAYLVARRDSEPLVEGQTLDTYLLPSLAILAGGSDFIWLLDTQAGVLLQVNLDSGEIGHIAGALQGGSYPEGDHTSALDLLYLDDPGTFWVDGEGSTVLVADQRRFGGAVLYGLNLGSESKELAGRTLPPERVVHMGGRGDEPFYPGIPFDDLAIEQVNAAVAYDGGLYLAVADRFAPPLVYVDQENRIHAMEVDPLQHGQALAITPAGVLVAASAEDDHVLALNLGDESTSMLEVSLPPGQWVTLFDGDEEGYRSLSYGASSLYGITVAGEVVHFEASGPQPEGETDATSLAVTADGGLFALDEGALWAKGDGEVMLGEPLPAEWTRIRDAVSGWQDGTSIWTRPFGSNINALAVDGQGNLAWVDGAERALFRAAADVDQAVTASSGVELLARGEPIPRRGQPTILEAMPNGTIFLANRQRIWRYTDSSGLQPFAGGGTRLPSDGDAGDELWLSGITGLAAFGERGLLVRSSQGLVLLEMDGRVVAWTEELPSDPFDGSVWALSQSVEVIDEVPIVTFGGGVYEVAGWPF